MEKLRLVDKSKDSAEYRPHWRAAEVFSEARDESRGSEDAYLVSEHCVAVFDGVSTPGDPRDKNGKTPGQRAVEIGLATLRDNPDLMADDAVALMSERLKAAITEERLQGSPSFVFVAFFPKQNRIVRVGDASFLIDGVGHNPGMNADRAKAVIRKRMIGRALAAGTSEEEVFKNDPSREHLREMRIWQSNYTNNPEAGDYGYGVVNGDVVPDRFVEYWSVPADAKSVVLASDGYPPSVLRGTLNDTERMLVDLQREDPLGIKDEISVRAHKPRRGANATDDRTYLRFERD